MTKRCGEHLAGRPCFVCEEPLRADDPVILIPTEPADDEERGKMERGQAYNATAEVAHALCGLYLHEVEEASS